MSLGPLPAALLVEALVLLQAASARLTAMMSALVTQRLLRNVLVVAGMVVLGIVLSLKGRARLSISQRWLARLSVSQGGLASDNERDHGLVVGRGGRDFSDELPLTQDHATVGDGDNFF